MYYVHYDRCAVVVAVVLLLLQLRPRLLRVVVYDSACRGGGLGQ
jgi:hypothetical protein